MSSPLTIAVLGAGARGADAYGQFALTHPQLIKYAAVAEPDPARRDKLARAHGIEPRRCYTSWQDLIHDAPPVDAVFNCTQDAMHMESALAVINAGYAQLLEKPIAATPLDCVRVVDAAARKGCLLAICHVLRYTPVVQALKELLMSGRVGEPVYGEFKENVAFWHYVAAYVRGPWKNAATSTPMIISKSCHDMDLILYLMNRRPKRVSSFGALTYFREENMPTGAPDHCLDGCPHEPECPYSVQKINLSPPGSNGIPEWARYLCMTGLSQEHDDVVEHIRSTGTGRCVYKAGHDVVDHQQVNIDFDGGQTASFTMHAFCHTNHRERTLRMGCTRGDLRAAMDENQIEYTRFLDGRVETLTPGRLSGGHAGGDTAMMRQFAQAMRENNPDLILTNAEVSLDSHLLGFAAEYSRINNGEVVDIDTYRKQLRAELEMQRA